MRYYLFEADDIGVIDHPQPISRERALLTATRPVAGLGTELSLSEVAAQFQAVKGVGVFGANNGWDRVLVVADGVEVTGI